MLIRFTYSAVFLIVILGAVGALVGWSSWKLPLVALLGLVSLHAFLVWLSRPTRHRAKRFNDFPDFLGPWPEQFDRGSRILIEAESPEAHRLAFQALRPRQPEDVAG